VKKLSCVILAALVMAGTASAAPFLVCDPYPTTKDQPDLFEVTITPLAPFVVPAVKNADGSVQIKYDLTAATAMGAGAHTATAVALKGAWRSGASNPYPFTVPTLAVPTGISIVGQ
jgi:hypothetical protein